MLRVLKPFEYFDPLTIHEALQILSRYGAQAKVLAGGTDLLLSMKREEVAPSYIVHLRNIPELNDLGYDPMEGLRIGAMTTHQTISDSPIVAEKFGLLVTACSKIGSFQIRHMGTIGGNICKAGPSQDTIPSLLVLEAKLKLVSLQGERWVPIDQFFRGPFETVLRDGELLIEIQIPNPPPRSAGCYHWVTKNTLADETLVGVAVLMSSGRGEGICEGIKIGLGSVAPTPIRARRAEEALSGRRVEEGIVEEVAGVAADEINPRSQADYRRKVTQVLVRRAIQEVWRKLGRDLSKIEKR